MLVDEALWEGLLMTASGRNLYDLSAFRHNADSLLAEKRLSYMEKTLPTSMAGTTWMARTNLWHYYAVAEMWEEYEAALLGDDSLSALGRH